MKNTLQDTDASTQAPPQALKVKQVMAGLAIESIDESLLKYLAFLSKKLPIEAAYFLHVVPRFELYRSLFEKDTPVVAGGHVVSEALIKNMKAGIDRIFPEQSKLKISYDVREGDPLEELLKDVEEVNADLAIIGQKDSGEEHGILAKKLARSTKCNALVIPEKARHSLEKILVPIDFSPHSIKALQAAVSLKRQMKDPVEIICLNIYNLPDFASFKISRTREQLNKMVKEDRMEAFDAFVNSYAPDEKEAIQKVLLQREMPWVPHYIKKYALENKIDFVIMGAKGHSKVDLLLMGSVTEKFLTINKRIPTLVIK